MTFNNRQKFWLSALAATLLAVVLYWPTLSLPLMFDDLLHIRLTSEVDFVSVWLPNKSFGFYRPFVFVPMLVIEALFGRFPALLLHAINLFQHALNCFLLAWLAWRLGGKWQHALAAGLFLATYPFAYQAVAQYGNNIYLTTSSFVLALLHLHLSQLQSNQSKGLWLLIMLPLFLFGLLTHELFVLFGPLAVLLQFAVVDDPPRRPQDYKLVVLFTFLGGLYILLYQFLPTGDGPSPDLGTTALLPKLLYGLQALVFPIGWLANLTSAFSEVFVIVGLVLIAVLTAWAAQTGEWKKLMLGWGWWLLAVLIIVVNLPTYYILHGARLVYLSGIGAALLWAMLLVEIWERVKFGRILYTLPLLFVVATGWQFVRDRLKAFDTIAEPVRILQQTLPDKHPGDGVLFVNLPAWTAPITTTFPVGVEYATLMGDHLFAEELVAEHVGGNHPVLAVDMPDLLANPSTYSYGIHDQAQLDVVAADWVAQGSHVFVSRYKDEGIVTTYAGAFLPPEEAGVKATFGGYELISAEARNCPDGTLIDLIWRVQGDEAPSATTSMFVQLLDASGVLIAQLDGAPLGLNPTSYTLPSGWRLSDHRVLTPDTGEGTSVLLGSYDFTTGERFPAADAQGVPLQDNALTLPIMSCK